MITFFLGTLITVLIFYIDTNQREINKLKLEIEELNRRINNDK